jgi:hypothetical protein
MWIDVYEKLTNSEKEEFKRLANMLLSKTFIIRDYYDSKEEMMKISPEWEQYIELKSMDMTLEDIFLKVITVEEEVH